MPKNIALVDNLWKFSLFRSRREDDKVCYSVNIFQIIMRFQYHIFSVCSMLWNNGSWNPGNWMSMEVGCFPLRLDAGPAEVRTFLSGCWIQSKACFINKVLLERLREAYLIYVLCVAACPRRAELRCCNCETIWCKA